MTNYLWLLRVFLCNSYITKTIICKPVIISQFCGGTRVVDFKATWQASSKFKFKCKTTQVQKLKKSLQKPTLKKFVLILVKKLVN